MEEEALKEMGLDGQIVRMLCNGLLSYVLYIHRGRSPSSARLEAMAIMYRIPVSLLCHINHAHVVHIMYAVQQFRQSCQSAVSQNTQKFYCLHNYITSSACLDSVRLNEAN